MMRKAGPLFFFLLILIFITHSNAQEKFQLSGTPLAKSFTPVLVQDENPIDVLHYDLNLVIEPTSGTILGEARLTIRFLQPDAASFYLDLISLSVDSVLLDDARINFKTENQRIVIPVENPVDTTIVAVFYHGRPANDGFGGFFFGSRTIWTVGEGLYTNPPSMFRYWVPSHDDPSDKATLDMKVTVPQPLQVVSNGLLVSTMENSENGTVTFDWKESHPIATYLIAVSIDEYAVFTENYISVSGDTIPLQFYVYPKNLERAQEDWKDTAKMIVFFERKFVPFPFDKYGMVEVPMRGAMEHQSMTSYSSGLITGDHRYDYIVAHELAHQWWGDLVTLSDWRNIWLNEGFATYCEALYFESMGGDSARQKYMENLQTIYFGEVTRLGNFPIYDPKYLWGGTVYQKGAWILNMLRWNVGDSLFFQSLRTYANRFAYGNAATDDLKNTFEDVSGQNLDWFFDQWVYGEGFPELEVGWEMTRAGNAKYIVGVKIRQKQKSDKPFYLPMEIEIQTALGNVLDTVIVKNRENDFQFTVNGLPRELVVDPNHWLLKKADIITRPLPPGFKPDEFNLAQNYPNPFMPGSGAGPTKIILQIGIKNSPFWVSLKIYNILGQKVRTLANKRMAGGLYTFSWDGANDSGKPLPSGIYLCRLKSETKVMTKKISLLRN
ncbi:MAG: T9SS type A sorting domain-containing protein [Calditrichaeota bacterium]|nr:T9SS type A sorting domain-containing protein [Calditrichota bacterium]